jgi:pimeloyl-ACP methyl ester carboxylesterase
VAHDLGGLVALRALLVEGAAYASLFLVDVVAIPPSGSPFFRFVQDNPGLLGQLPAYVHEAIVRAYVGNATHGGISPEELDALVQPWTADLPVRILWGAEDSWIPVETGRHLASLVPGATPHRGAAWLDPTA